MNDMTKLVLTFIAGVLVGVLGATSTLFKGEPDPAPTQTVTTSAGTAVSPADGGASEQSATQGETAQASPEQPATESESAESAAEPSVAEETPEMAQDEPTQAEAAAEVAEAPDETLLAEAQDGEERIFCMLMENSGQCRCYNAETTAPVDVSAEECRDQLAEE